MEWDEKEFGCLCKNVGGHFLCLFHGLNVKVYYWSVVMEFIKAIRKFGIFKIGKVWYFLPSIHFAIKIKNKKAI